MLHIIHKQQLAEQDLINIWLYSYSEWGEKQADKYLDDLEQAMALLAHQPLSCKLREEFSPAVRIHHCKHHLIIYLENKAGIRIIRVLHESMDVQTQLQE